VTAWSLFGAYDWNHLVTCTHGVYEPSVFDVRGPRPRPTALAGLVRQLAAGQTPSHPALDSPGWWRQPERLSVRPLWTGPGAAHKVAVRRTAAPVPEPRPMLITGATGTLGRAFARICQGRALRAQLLLRQELDIADPASVARALDERQPWAVINTAGYVRVDQAETDAERCFRENARGPAELARACAARGVRLVTFSSDLVFDGVKDAAYVESDEPAPLNVYGRSKAEAEQRVLAADASALVVRTSAFFGHWDTFNFVYDSLRRLAAGEAVLAAADALVSPTYVPDLVHACLDLLIDGECGLWHLANVGAVTWAELAETAARRAGISARGLRGQPTRDLDLPAPRPLNSVLASERGWIMPTLEDALERFLAECEGPWRQGSSRTGQAPQALHWRVA
jgi:dTDP-4-dehydrorhamnose reductase